VTTEQKPESWAADRPGETPGQAKNRAHETIRRAAAGGNPTARKMAKKLPVKQAKKTEK
jgi:hypothetical protein